MPGRARSYASIATRAGAAGRRASRSRRSCTRARLRCAGQARGVPAAASARLSTLRHSPEQKSSTRYASSHVAKDQDDIAIDRTGSSRTTQKTDKVARSPPRSQQEGRDADRQARTGSTRSTRRVDAVREGGARYRRAPDRDVEHMVADGSCRGTRHGRRAKQSLDTIAGGSSRAQRRSEAVGRRAQDALDGVKAARSSKE